MGVVPGRLLGTRRPKEAILRTFVANRPKLAVGMKLALAMMTQGKPAAAPAAPGNAPTHAAAGMAAMMPKGVLWALVEERGERSLAGALDFATSMSRAESSLDPLAGAEFRPLTFDQARLWLQSYNAGPYATLRWRGNVPYRETRNYVPKIMGYYGTKLDHTPFEPFIQSSARKYGLDPQLIRAVMKAESDFKVRDTSHAGARGLMQVMPCVWTEVRRLYGITWSYSGNVYDPEKNVEVACAYLAWLRWDFLPKHFAEFDADNTAPPQVHRDRVHARRGAQRMTVATPKALEPAAAAYAAAAAARAIESRPPGAPRVDAGKVAEVLRVGLPEGGTTAARVLASAGAPAGIAPAITPAAVPAATATGVWLPADEAAIAALRLSAPPAELAGEPGGFGGHGKTKVDRRLASRARHARRAGVADGPARERPEAFAGYNLD